MPEIILSAHAGRVQARYHHNPSTCAPLVIVLHPHPLQGGTMNNRVTHRLFKTFVENGFCALRFNFRGVGNSQGVYDKGEGELSDTAYLLDWMQSINPGTRQLWVAGFSFGAWIGMQLLMRRPEFAGFISVSPPVNVCDFAFLAPCPVSGMIINGSDDNICPVDHVDRLVEKLRMQKRISIDYRIIQNCDHSFSNHLETLDKYVSDYINSGSEFSVKAANM